MTEIAKYLWLLFLAALTLGVWTIPLLIIYVVILLLIKKYKPHWLE